MAREAGAKKVYFASAAPELRFPNVYGIDMAVKSELIAHDKTSDEICKEIGADALFYQNLDDLIRAVTPTDEEAFSRDFECSVFTGEYVTGDIDEVYLKRLEKSRADKIKQKKNGDHSDEIDELDGVVDSL